ncbi:unnamed protein product [Rangifer tarandus platyrhynchus]|uniref:Uncharacterized protein n=2 Tax=Rangifer tarandus platyrhynchus TaxID=3082113 RepID=A0ABN8ZHY2_RANTA|nr:unnamed protein product [Rangifer tarandus platyrhynchus]CAI9707601.1 unnamed protein product [Rangifer tarandus platyrhynchus]
MSVWQGSAGKPLWRPPARVAIHGIFLGLGTGGFQPGGGQVGTAGCATDPSPRECRTAGLQPSTGQRADLRHGCRGFLSSTKALVCEIRGRCRQRLLQHHVADQADRGDRGPLS